MAGKYSVTPKGELLWAHVTQADTTYKAEGQYHCKLILRGDDAENFIREIDASHEGIKRDVLRNKGKGFREFMPYKVNTREDGSEDGYQFHFKLKASGTNGKTGEAYTQRPIVVGPDRKPLPSDIKVANGSVAKVAYELAPYHHMSSLGVQLRLRGVQVLKLIEYLEGASDMFDEEEGYEVTVSAPTTAEDTFPEEADEDEDF